MSYPRRVGAVRMLLGSSLALLGVVLASATPAGAISPEECGVAKGKLSVDLEGTPTLMAQLDGTFAGPVTVRVHCKNNGGTSLGLIPNAVVTISTTVPNATLNGVNPLSLTLPTGQQTVQMVSTNPNLSAGQWSATVGQGSVSVSEASGLPLVNDSGKSKPYSYDEAIFAQTPELSSLVLFGSGAAAMAGYGLVRLRALRRRLGE